jgi:DNA-binding transcriptional LysR family regulator
MLVVKKDALLANQDRVCWADVLALPLCLLHQGMQNRRILDEELSRHGLAINPQATADSYVTLLAMAQSGAYATIIPDSYTTLVPDWAKMITFDPPAEASRIGLIVADRTPLSALAIAALTMAEYLQPPEE